MRKLVFVALYLFCVSGAFAIPKCRDIYDEENPRYPFPLNCRKYWWCSKKDSKAELFNCPQSVTFDPITRKCNGPYWRKVENCFSSQKGKFVLRFLANF